MDDVMTGPDTQPAERRRGAHRREPGRARRRTALLAWVVALTLPAAAAAALWTVGGSGSGQGRAVTVQNLVVTPGTPTAQLYPGGSGDVVYSVTNPNPFPVRVTGVSPGAVTGEGACGASSFTTSTGTVAPVTIAADATATVTVVGGVTMVVAATDACQGVVVTVAGTLVAAQA
jgi:hypothetical protein